MPGNPGISIGQTLSAIIEREGGYVNNPNDKGGPTKYGITQRTLADFRGKPVSAKDVKALTPQEAKKIYWLQYVKPFSFVNDQRLLDLVADSSVHHGPQRAARWLQGALGVDIDGRPEAATIEAFKNADSQEVYDKVLAQREQLIKKLGQTPSQRGFAEGWNKRLGEFKNDGSGTDRGNP